MYLVGQVNSFLAPKPLTPRGADPVGSAPRWWSWVAAMLGSESSRRWRALGVFAAALLFVVFAASDAVAQADELDSDNDGLSDDVEVATYGTDPEVGDTDGDGLPDGVEITLRTDPLKADTDGDGVSDASEYLAGGDPLEWSANPVAVPVTPVPSSVPSGPGEGQGTVIGETAVTVSPNSQPVPSNQPLPFDDSVGSGRSPLFPFYVALACAMVVGVVFVLTLLPDLKAERNRRWR